MISQIRRFAAKFQQSPSGIEAWYPNGGAIEVFEESDRFEVLLNRCVREAKALLRELGAENPKQDGIIRRVGKDVEGFYRFKKDGHLALYC